MNFIYSYHYLVTQNFRTQSLCFTRKCLQSCFLSIMRPQTEFPRITIHNWYVNRPYTSTIDYLRKCERKLLLYGGVHVPLANSMIVSQPPTATCQTIATWSATIRIIGSRPLPSDSIIEIHNVVLFLAMSASYGVRGHTCSTVFAASSELLT